MDNEVKAWLYDMLTAINEIESFFADRPKRFTDYCNDVRTKRAVERNIGIIGEAMNRVLKHDCAIPVSSARKIVDVRNRVIQKLFKIHIYKILLRASAINARTTIAELDYTVYS